VAGLLGLLGVAAGLFLSLIGGEIVTDQDLLRAGSTVGLALLLALAGGLLLLWLLPRSTRFGGLVLRTRLGRSDGEPEPERGRSAAVRPGPAPAEPASLVGARGVALSDLRPGGIARIDGQRTDVVSQGDYISAGEPIEVIADEGYRRVVRRLERDEEGAPPAGSSGGRETEASKGGGGPP
jgi:membrane-bound serine protease (ClpP class)